MLDLKVLWLSDLHMKQLVSLKILVFKVVRTPDTELFIFLHPVGCVKRKELIILKGNSANVQVLGTTEYVKEKL